MKTQARPLLSKIWLSFAGLGLLSGSATQKPAARTEYFFPPPPDAPRLQYLTGFSSEKEFGGAEAKSLMTFLTGAKRTDKELGKPYGAAAWGKKLFVCDTAMSAVLILDMDKRHFGVLEAQGEGALKLPLNITADTDGTCYVADTGREQVVLFDKEGKFVAAMGAQGEMKPRDVAVNANRVYVADLLKRNVHVFDKATRKPLFDIPRSEDQTNKIRGVFTPTHIALDSK